ncbi:MAG: hypothetical protein MZV64_08510 [Ignavibacteriales bacterium]|nr:hypothetical protein [Ignavibacteriales bacterium]
MKFFQLKNLMQYLLPVLHFLHLMLFQKLKRNMIFHLFADYRDLWYKSYFAFYPTPFHKIIHKNKEYHSIKSCRLELLLQIERLKKNFLIHYPFLTFDDVVIISHGYDHEDFDKISAQPKPQNKMVLMYSGIFMVYSTPEYFFKSF